MSCALGVRTRETFRDLFLQGIKMSRYGASLKHLILEACNILTIAVPPALPAGRFFFCLEISKVRGS